MVVSNGTLNQSISLGKPTNIAKYNEIVGLKDKFIEEGIIMEILRTAYVYAVIIARTFKE